MAATIEGVYQNGRIELNEHLPEIADGEAVLVTVKKMTEIPTPKEAQYMRLGMIKTSRELTEEDFKLAEFHGDPDDGLDWS